VKNLASGENNFSDVHEELFFDFLPVSGKTLKKISGALL